MISVLKRSMILLLILCLLTGTNAFAAKKAAETPVPPEVPSEVIQEIPAAIQQVLNLAYDELIETNGQNLEKMLNLMSLYKRVNCTESEVYFAAAEKAHQMQPTEESAAGCAKMCYKKEDWKGALKYYQEAVSLIEEADDEDKDDYYYMMVPNNY